MDVRRRIDVGSGWPLARGASSHGVRRAAGPARTSLLFCAIGRSTRARAAG
jgi:hypothetical protein